MKCVRVVAAGRYSIDDIPQPVCGPDDVIVRIAACGICGSDIHYVRSGMLRPGGEPLPLGHEAAGTIEAVGENVGGYSAGMRVLINPIHTDGETIGNGGREGAFCDRLLIRNADEGAQLIPMPEGLPFAHAAIAEPFAVALHGVNRGEAGPGSKVALFGCGPIGLAAIVWLKRRGVTHVAAIDISDARLARAREMGADATINPKTDDLFASLASCHGAGETVMDSPCVGTTLFLDMAGGPTVIRDIFRLAQSHARVVITAVYPEPVPFDLIGILMKELTITTAGGYPEELPQALTALAEIDPALRERYISHSFPFERFTEAFDVAAASTSAKVMIEFA
jgi:threonine dehydrogenase-like Zn-dependent dehydrogenase